MSPSSTHSSASGELWGFPLMPNKVYVDIFLPNGIFISLETSRECGLLELKETVWNMAKEQPLYDRLLENNAYVFVGVTKDAETEEFYDEHRRLCDIHLFQPILKLAAAKGNREEKMLKQTITQAVGVSIDEFVRRRNPEVDDFRRDVASFCKSEVEARNRCCDPHALIAYCYPPRVEPSPKLPLHTTENLLSNTNIVIRVWVVQENSFQTHASVCVPCDTTPTMIISEVVKKKVLTFNNSQSSSTKSINEHYVLKVCGLNEYLEGNFPICQYKYIRQCVNRGELPDVMLESVKQVLMKIPPHLPYMQPNTNKHKHNKESRPPIMSHMLTQNFKVLVNIGIYLNVGENLYVYANLYHGTKPLCEGRKTVELGGTEAPKWNQWLAFDIKVADIPRCAKLCVAVCGVRRKKDEHWPLAWANIPLYNYTGKFIQGQHTVRLWHPPCHMDGMLNPIGVTGSNPMKETPCLELEFEGHRANVEFTQTSEGSIEGDYTELAFDSPPLDDGGDLKGLMNIVSRDPLSPLTQDERMLLWRCRGLCKEVPQSLPKLLQSVKWEGRELVKEFHSLLATWPRLPPEFAIELLDCKYPDPKVRRFATECLDVGLTDDGLLKYLLQLVTAIKFEFYLDNPLVRFLLKRAINNLRIGHYLFWHLKSEMYDVQVSLQFGLLLEAYCRSCGPYLEQLVRQTEILTKLKNVNTILQKDDNISQKALKEYLCKPDYQEILQNNLSPLNPAYKLENLRNNSCEVKSSAKRPIILQWHSADPLAEYFQPVHGILFKNGDDLRQDMLTLQVLRVMDEIWQSDDLDLCISPYICISMGHNVGMIEIVQNAETVMNVQKKGGVVGSLQLRNGTLHQWLKDNNPGEKQYNKAIHNFTRSCAGYCVATLVLGIADRHNDNIMIKKNGQMFHIDFGHFLNHKKKKYGICRNRVPFVLPGDFLRIICRGSTTELSKTYDYKHFEDLCCRAYLSIRSHANLIINLFCMMLGAGLPELTSFDDIEYIRTSLAVEKDETQAVQYFRDCLAAAQDKQWTTKVDWVCHAVRNSVRK
ncbi:phosphatidylinositol 4,5-bisphosphate 3-kinase catalytic subunit alpha isoform-like [Ciona intestinalis]